MRLAPIKSQVKSNCPIFLGNALVYKLQLSIKTKRVDNNKNDTHITSSIINPAKWTTI